MNIFKNNILFFAVFACVCCILAFSGCNFSDTLDNSPAVHRDADNSTTKKGTCVSRYNLTEETNSSGKSTGTALSEDSIKENGEKINALDVGWWYNWDVRPGNKYIKSQFVPMVWGKAQVTESNLSYIEENYKNGTFTSLLTFNEPDLADQANMSVEEALYYWPQLEEIGVPLSSPAVSYYSAETGNEWLDEFMTIASEKDYRVDFIAIHLYQSFYSSKALTQLKDTLNALYEKYQLPIWLTEFGALDIVARDSHQTSVTASCTVKNTQKYMEQTTNWMEQTGFVYRYAWFLDNFNQKDSYRPWEAPYTSLYNDDDSVSQTGEYYRDILSNTPLVFETASIPSAKINAIYSQTVLACGGTGNYTFSASGLPQGLTVSKNGIIGGTPTQKGIYPVRITVTDEGKSGRKQTVTYRFTLTVTD